MILSNYEPKRVLHHFEAISQMPRGSGNEKGVSDFIAAFAKGQGLKCVQDALYNLVIFKPGTAGYENSPPVILQGHLDMVCEKNAGTVHDFMTDPLQLYVDGEYLKAKGTTLGADNGIAVAMCMALLEATDIAHPPLEVVLTTDEEAGMGGALNLDFGLFKGRRMFNLDSSTEGAFIVGCAAGAIAEFDLAASWEAAGAFTDCYTLAVKGLTGGHSGGDIHLGRGNAIRILGQVLNSVAGMEMRIAHVNGGMKVNAIPREAEAVIAIKPEDAAKLQAAFTAVSGEKKGQYRNTDPGLEITLTPASAAEKVLPPQSGKHLIDTLVLLPCGVLAMSKDIEDLVSASNNVGVLETLGDKIKITCMARGASNENNEETEKEIKKVAVQTGATLVFTQRSPAWPYNAQSELLTRFAAGYKRKYGKDAKVTVIHAGLECGIFVDNLPGVDVISFGPDIHDLHTPDERLNLASAARVWEFFCEVLGEMK